MQSLDVLPQSWGTETYRLCGTSIGRWGAMIEDGITENTVISERPIRTEARGWMYIYVFRISGVAGQALPLSGLVREN